MSKITDKIKELKARNNLAKRLQNTNQETKELENTPEKVAYQFGDGKNSLVLSIAEEMTYGEVMDMNLEPLPYSEKLLELDLSYNDESIYRLSEAESVSFSLCKGFSRDRDEAIKGLSKKLLSDDSKNSIKVRRLLSKISGHPLIDGINKQMELIKEAQYRELNNTTLGRVRMKMAKTVEEATGVKLPKASLGFKKKVEKPLSEIIDFVNKKRVKD